MNTDIRIKINRICDKMHEGSPCRIIPLKSSGSARKYYRLEFAKSSLTLIACHSENEEENQTFIRLTAYFEKVGLPVPHILGTDKSINLYILEDLGDRDLMSLLISRDGSNKEWHVISKTLENLVRFQRLPQKEWHGLVGFKPLAKDLINYDFEYAVNNLFIPMNIGYDEGRLRDEFQVLETALLSYPVELWGLMYRDFQSRNIMIKDGKPYFIDYQSCRYGPGIYDLVSFAWQAKARFSQKEREKITELYCRILSNAVGCSVQDTITTALPYWAAFRIIQTLGAYGLRGIKEGKTHFIESLHPALHNLLDILEGNGKDGHKGLVEEMPELTHIVRSLISFL